MSDFVSPLPCVVYKFGGSSLSEISVLGGLLKAEAGQRRAVVVHGGGPEIQRMLDRVGLISEFREGLRVTDGEAMEIVEMVLAGRVNKRIVAQLQSLGLQSVGLSGADGGTLAAEVHGDGSWGRVGRVPEVKTKLLETLLTAGFVPVVSPVALGTDHEPLNVNADTAASAIAAALGAQELVFCTDVPGLKDGDGITLGRIGVTDVQRLIASGVIQGGMIPKMEAALLAVANGVERVRVGSLSHPDSGTVLEKEPSDVQTFR